MKELELVFEVLERGPYSVETLGFANGGVVVVVGWSEVLNEDETRAVSSGVSGGIGKRRRVFEGFEGSEKVGSGNRVNCVAELVVEVPNFFENGFDFFHLHIPFHFRFEEDGRVKTEATRTVTPNNEQFEQPEPSFLITADIITTVLICLHYYGRNFMAPRSL